MANTPNNREFHAQDPNDSSNPGNETNVLIREPLILSLKMHMVSAHKHLRGFVVMVGLNVNKKNNHHSKKAIYD